MSNQLPGQRTGYTATPREIFLSGANITYLPGPVVLDASYAYDGGNTNKTDEIRSGWLLAQVTALGTWVPYKRTLVTSGTSGSGTGAGQTTITVDNAAAFKTSEVCSVPTQAGRVSRTISSINYTTNVITFTVAVDNVSIAQAIYVTTFADSVSAAGCEIARAIATQTVRLLPADPFNATWYDASVQAAITGYVDEDMVLGDLGAARAESPSYLTGFQWGDQHGQS